MLPRLIQTLHHRYQSFWNRERVTSLLWAFLFFGIALTFQKYADEFVVSNGGTVVRDLFLDIIPALDIDGIIISTTLIFTVVATLLGLSKPEYIIFSIKSIALFVVIRGFFIMLTHLGIHPDQIVL